MTHIPGDLISRYFDGDLTSDELRELQDWLRSSSDHIREFTRACWLHDRLRGELQSISQENPTPFSPAEALPPASARYQTRSVAITACLIAVVAFLSLFWLEVGTTQVSAATELNRLISAQNDQLDRTYEIDVEEITASRRRQGNKQRPIAHRSRRLMGLCCMFVTEGNLYWFATSWMDGHSSQGATGGRVGPFVPTVPFDSAAI